MASVDTMAVKLQKLIGKINEVTNSEDKNLIDAINTLINKYEEVAIIVEAVAGELGTINNPIDYNGNIKLEKDKYYMQDGVLYICAVTSDFNVYHPLTELSEYVQKVE